MLTVILFSSAVDGTALAVVAAAVALLVDEMHFEVTLSGVVTTFELTAFAFKSIALPIAKPFRTWVEVDMAASATPSAEIMSVAFVAVVAMSLLGTSLIVLSLLPTIVEGVVLPEVAAFGCTSTIMSSPELHRK